MLTTLFVVTIYLLTNPVSSWAYDEDGDDASHWADYYAECGYSRQSPIDIPLNDLSAFKECEEALELQWTSEPSHYAIRNTGKSLLAMPFAISYSGGVDISGLEVLHHTNDTNIRITNSFYHTYDSPINKEYCFDSLHFHWGETNADGSEHTVNGNSYPLEVHLVHYSCDYPIAGDAINDYATGQTNIKYDDDNVLAVIGVIFEIGKPNLVLDKILDDMIIDGVYDYQTKSQSANDVLLELYYTDFDLKGLLPESREIVGYLGSLTTPPCFETVRWHVLKERMTVSEEQMMKFRMLLSYNGNDTQSPNFRPVMPLNDRTIYHCKEDIEDDALYTDSKAKDEHFASLNTDSTISSADDATRTMTESELIWRMVGISFICLFIVTLTICMVAAICLCKHWDQICNKNKRKISMELEKQHANNIEMQHAESVYGHSTNIKVIGGN